MTLLLSGLSAPAGEPAPPAAGTVELLETNSRTPYVHRLTLYDEHGTVINPKDERPAPYSPRATCGKCHPYGEISRGWHFNAVDPNVPPGRPGEPWFLVDTKAGLVVPISGRAWPGAFRPEQLGLSDWEFVLRFGHHLPGGSFGGPDPARVAQAKEKLRWAVSGPLEIDCMFCHSADNQHDPAEAARQIEAQNFRWAATVALGLAVIRGEARKAPDDWDPTLPPNPDYPEQSGPRLIYDRTKFDADNRVFFNVTRRPANERCYFCHSFRQVGPNATDDLLEVQDVHLAAGLLCVDCHRNEVDHRIVRGYPGEAQERGEPALAAFTCEGCHLGASGADEVSVVLGGRYRAPHPQHRGLPPLHFEKLTCTACHSGPWPELVPKQFQTAMAHGLGLPARDRPAQQPPVIVGPIFARQSDGRIAPQRLVWPALYARVAKNRIVPATLAEVSAARTRGVQEAAQDARRRPPNEVAIRAATLDALVLDERPWEVPIYTQSGWAGAAQSSGKLEVWPFRGEGAAAHADVIPGSTEAVAVAAAAPYRWPLAHDVRPAAQSLGVRGCTDCHALDAPIDFGRVAPPAADHAPATQPGVAPATATMLELRGDDPQLRRLWAWAFRFRPIFKAFGLTCATLILLVLLRFLVDAVVRPVPPPAASAPLVTPRAGMTVAEHVGHAMAIAGLVTQAATGVGGELLGAELGGWRLLVHMGGAGLFIVGLTGTALQWAGRCRPMPSPATAPLTAGQRWMFFLYVTAGWVVMTVMLVAMLPVAGYREQEWLKKVHENSALVLLAALVIHAVISWAARRKRGKVR